MTIKTGNKESFAIDHVASTVTLPILPSINLRQSSASSLGFVTIANGASQGIVTINTTVAAVGTYSLVLESYDTAAPSSTLKTDFVTIYVTGAKCSLTQNDMDSSSSSVANLIELIAVKGVSTDTFNF